MKKMVQNIVEDCMSLLGGKTMVTLNLTPQLEYLCSSGAKIEALNNGLIIQQNLKAKTISIKVCQTGVTSNPSSPVKTPPKKAKIEKPDPNVPFSDYIVPTIMGDILAILQSPKTCNMWFFGPTQCGKTTAVRYIGYKLNRKVESINCRGDMDSHHFFGHNTIVNGNIVFQKGAVEKSMTEGLNDKGEVVGEPGILFIDEASAMPSEIGIGMNNTLETGHNVRTLTLPEDGNRVVKSHPGWRVILAGNNNGTGANDIASQAYTAQQCALDASQTQRVTATFRFGYDRKAEEIIVRRACNEDEDEGIISLFLQFKQGIRDALKRGNELTTPFSTKKVIDIFDMFPVFMKGMSGNSETIKKIALGKAIYYSAYEMLTEEEKIKYDELWYPLTKDKIGRWSPAMNTSSETDYM